MKFVFVTYSHARVINNNKKSHFTLISLNPFLSHTEESEYVVVAKSCLRVVYSASVSVG